MRWGRSFLTCALVLDENLFGDQAICLRVVSFASRSVSQVRVLSNLADAAVNFIESSFAWHLGFSRSVPTSNFDACLVETNVNRTVLDVPRCLRSCELVA